MGGSQLGRDEDLSRALYEEHVPSLTSYAQRLMHGDRQLAEDIVQETLLRAMCAGDSFQPGSNLRAWLFRILTNAFINGYRKRRRH